MKIKSIIKKISTLLCISIALTITGCGTNNGGQVVASNQTEGQGKVVNIGVTFSPSTINPLSPVGVVSTYAAQLMFQPLLEIDENMEFKPMLADSIETSDNTTFTINLNKNAKWTDGEPVTVDDVIFTMKLIANEEVASINAYQYNIFQGFNDSGYIAEGTTDIPGIEKVDDYTLKLKTKNPVSLNVFDNSIGRNLMAVPEHVLQDIAPENINKDPFFQKPTVTNGPFKLLSYDRDHYVQFEANKDYFKGSPKIDQLNFKVMQSTEIAARLQNGEIDMNIPSFGVIPVEDFDKVKSLYNITTNLAEPIANEYVYINEASVPDAKTRQALVYATNRKQIVDDLLKGNGEVIDGYFTSYSPYFDKTLTPTEYNTETAKKLLQESGWDSSKTLTLSVLSGDSSLEQAANVMVANLKEVGVNVQIKMTDLATLVDSISKMDYDIGILQYSLTPIDPYPDMAYFLQEGNVLGYNNKEVQGIIESIRNETDDAKIKEAYNKINKIASTEVPMFSLYASRSLGAVNKRLIGAEAKDFGTFIDVQNWDVK